MLKLLNSIPVLYLVMLIPGRFAVWGLFDRSWYFAQMMSDTGTLSIQLLLITLSVTPLTLLINRIGRGQALGRWFLKRRKHFGLGSFLYAVLHAVHYMIETGSLKYVMIEVLELKNAVGWIAFGIFLALTVTSNAKSVRQLGRKWKQLHYWVYPAAALSFLHWYLYDYFTQRVLLWLALFVAAKIAHVGLRMLHRRSGATSPQRDRPRTNVAH